MPAAGYVSVQPNASNFYRGVSTESVCLSVSSQLAVSVQSVEYAAADGAVAVAAAVVGNSSGDEDEDDSMDESEEDESSDDDDGMAHPNKEPSVIIEDITEQEV